MNLAVDANQPQGAMRLKGVKYIPTLAIGEGNERGDKELRLFSQMQISLDFMPGSIFTDFCQGFIFVCTFVFIHVC